MTNTDMKVTVIIPAKEEAATIGPIIDGSAPYADELIVIDGHSKDGTAKVAEEKGARVILDRGRGKGDAVRVGIENAAGDVIAFIDADGSHDPNDIPKLVRPIVEEGYDLVIGSRMVGGSDELHGTLGEATRLMGNTVTTLVINWRFNVRQTDYQNGLRAIRTSVARSLGLRSNIPTIEQEMAIKCLKRGYKVTEVGTHEYKRKAGVTKIPILKIGYRFPLNLLKNILF